MNEIEQTSKISSIYCLNKNSKTFDIRTDIKCFQQNMLSPMIDKNYVIKENNLRSHYLLPVKRITLKSDSKLFEVSKRCIIEKKYTIKTK